MARILIRRARVLTLDGDDRELDRADILVDGARIAAIGAQLDAAGVDRVIEADGKLAMPGLVNGHFHSPGNMMCGALTDMPLELFMLYEVPPGGEGAMGHRLAYVQTLLGAVEMLKAGITAVHDDPYHNPAPTTDGIDAIMQAYADAGIRATVSINHPNRIEYEKYPFLADLLPDAVKARMAAVRRWPAAEIGALYRWFLERWHGQADGRLRIAVSNSAPQRVTDDYFATLSEFSRAHDLPFDIHMLETRLQRVFGQEVWGKSLVRQVHDLGFLDRRMLVIHAIWVDEADMELLAAAGCTVAHNPVCNLKLGSGVMPFRRLSRHGIPIALGTDERNTDDTTNVWGAMKTAGLIHKIAEPDYRDWPSAAEVLACATRGGARGMGLEGRIGVLAPGAQADLILVDLDTLPFTPLNDLRRQLVFCENGASVRLTMVAGRVVVEDGRVLSVDEPALRAEVRALAAEFRDSLAATDRAAAALEPFYRAMLMRALDVPVGMERRAGPMTP
ncbi:MAG: amidohydrolase family protein [Burkholderiales bacterium]|nr:amidohydrolase family protein [Burkholderiales bacterium]